MYQFFINKQKYRIAFDLTNPVVYSAIFHSIKLNIIRPLFYGLVYLNLPNNIDIQIIQLTSLFIWFSFVLVFSLHNFQASAYRQSLAKPKTQKDELGWEENPLNWIIKFDNSRQVRLHSVCMIRWIAQIVVESFSR